MQRSIPLPTALPETDYCYRLAPISFPSLERTPHLATHHPADLINNFCNCGERRRGGQTAAERSARVGGGPRSGQRLRPRLPIGRDVVGCPGGRAVQRGRGLRERTGPAPWPAPLVPSPVWAAGVFKVGGQLGEPDIRERPAALLRRLLHSPSSPEPAVQSSAVS